MTTKPKRYNVWVEIEEVDEGGDTIEPAPMLPFKIVGPTDYNEALLHMRDLVTLFDDDAGACEIDHELERINIKRRK